MHVDDDDGGCGYGADGGGGDDDDAGGGADAYDHHNLPIFKPLKELKSFFFS